MRVKATEEVQYWSCNQFRVLGCTARATTGRAKKNEQPTIKLRGFHNHRIILKRRKPGECTKLKELYARRRLSQADLKPAVPEQQWPTYPSKPPLMEPCFMKTEK